jgi:hypothetical protein
MNEYFQKQNSFDISENDFYHVTTNNWNKIGDRFFLILLSPLMLVGVLHNYLPYIFIKRFVEKSFKRKVFWGSVKMMLGVVGVGLFNLIPLFLGHYLIYSSWSFWLFNYFIFAPLSGVIAYNWFKRLESFKKRKYIAKNNWKDLGAERSAILQEIFAIVPIA